MSNFAAYGCTNRSSVDKTYFHKIPPDKNSKLRKQWLHNLRRTGSLPKDSEFYICCAYFMLECFQRDIMVINFSLLKIFNENM